MTPTERATALATVAEEVRVCRGCRLAEQRTHAVPGEGSPDTEVVFVGEGPGFNEDQQGRPFVGAAGTFLDELIGAVGWRRSDVFITNVVKCRPPGNRDPEPDEMAACAPFLRRQLEALDPALIVTLGRFSLGTFMPGARISQVHGTVRPVDPATGARAAQVFAMYHPAAALRQGALKETMRDDMSRVPAALIASREARAVLEPPVTPEPPAAPEPPVMAAPPEVREEPEVPAPPEVPEPEREPLEAQQEPAAPVLEAAPPTDARETLDTIDDLAPLEIIGGAVDSPPETDQMRLF